MELSRSMKLTLIAGAGSAIMAGSGIILLRAHQWERDITRAEWRCDTAGPDTESYAQLAEQMGIPPDSYVYLERRVPLDQNIAWKNFKLGRPERVPIGHPEFYIPKKADGTPDPSRGYTERMCRDNSRLQPGGWRELLHDYIADNGIPGFPKHDN
jgi:hypothetical protein